MIIRKKVRYFSVFPLMLSLASCTQFSQLASQTSSQMQPSANVSSEGAKYPESAMIYNVCHERWLRNGFTNYTFNIEEGVYSSSSEIQRGNFKQVVVANRQVSSAASCQLSYHPKGSSCDQATRKRTRNAPTIENLFSKWSQNPGLYQSCHPVLGYPTGYGHTYGSGERRIDASKWFLVSSVIPRRSAPPVHKSRNDERRIASPSSVKQKVKLATAMKYASVTDLDITLISSIVKKTSDHSSLVSQFTVSNSTDLQAILGIKGWILDKDYKRYPLTVDDSKGENDINSRLYTLKVEPHTQTTVSYEAEGVPDIDVGKRTAAMLEIMSVDGVKRNLTLPNQ